MKVLESALYAENLEETAEFYLSVLGLEKMSEAPGRHIFIRLKDTVLLLFRPSATIVPPGPDARLPVPPHGSVGQGHLCFAATSEEIEDWTIRLTGAGVEIEADFHWPQGGRSIYFRDPAGNSLEFAEARIWGL